MSTTTFTLNTGAKIPAIAFGTYGAKGDDSYSATLTALKAGYRHIDTAYCYENEEPIGQAIKESGIPREELFITTKMWPTHAQDPASALDGSLKRLGLDYVDLYLVHWPFASVEDKDAPYGWGHGVDDSLDPTQIWHKFQELPKDKARALGVSNYDSEQLKKLLDDPQTKVVPAVDQVELHPELPQDKLVKYAQSKGIVVEAYSPLAQGQVNNATIAEIASKKGVDPGQVALAWNLGRNVVVLPRSVNPGRIESNLKEIKLEAAEVAEISKLAANKRRVVDPPFPGGAGKIFGKNTDSE